MGAEGTFSSSGLHWKKGLVDLVVSEAAQNRCEEPGRGIKCENTVACRLPSLHLVCLLCVQCPHRGPLFLGTREGPNSSMVLLAGLMPGCAAGPCVVWSKASCGSLLLMFQDICKSKKKA